MGHNNQCLICRQSDEVKRELEKRIKVHSMNDVCAWLHSIGISATRWQVGYYARKQGIAGRKTYSVPRESYKDKVSVYVGALLEWKMSTYSIKNLMLYGASWSRVSIRLRDDGLITDMGGRPRKRWRIVATKQELQEWMDKEMSK